MIYKFLILSDEVENFRREINIDADSTFYELYRAIIDSTNYDDKEMSSFFLCNDEWRKKQEITLVEMDTDSDVDIYVMDETPLMDFIEEEKQKLMFVFDYVNDRALYIKLAEIITGKSIKKPEVIVSEGEAPKQFIDIDEAAPVTTTSELDATFYGDEGFNLDELDESGFEGLDDLEEISQFSDLEI